MQIKSKFPKIKLVVYSIVVTVFIFFGLLITLGSFGFGQMKIYAITSGSMRPKIPMGSLVILNQIKKISIGDVITFKDGGRIISHRVVGKINNNQFQTKGDANPKPDRNPIKREQIIGRVIISLPKLGRLLMLLKTKVGVILLVIMPGAVLIWEELKNLLNFLLGAKAAVALRDEDKNRRSSSYPTC